MPDHQVERHSHKPHTRPKKDKIEKEFAFFKWAVGSAPFKWAMSAIGTGLLALLVYGWEAYLESTTSKNTIVVSTQADVSTLKSSVQSVASRQVKQDMRLDQADADRKHLLEVQGKIFTAIMQMNTDVHQIDLTVTKLDQEVKDLKLQKLTQEEKTLKELIK